LNPRRTFQHVRDFQSRSLDRSDTSPEGAQRIELGAGRQVVEVDALAGSGANAFPVQLELDLDACRRADGVEPESLLDGAPGFVERPDIVVPDAVPASRVTDSANVSVGAADNADDPVLGSALPCRLQLAASLLRVDNR
jgi:hypothetical protein